MIALPLDNRLLVVLLLCVLSFCWGPGAAVGQEAEDSQTESNSTPQVSASPARPERFSPGGWASTVITGRNPTDSDVTEVVSLYLADDPTTQYAKQFWLPANSKRSTWLGIRIPETLPQNTRYVNLSMMRIDQTQGEERFGANLNGEPIRNRSLMMTTNEINTGLIMGDVNPLYSADSDAEISERELITLVNLARDEGVTDGMDLPMLEFRSQFLSPTQSGLDELDQLIIAGNLLQGDTTGIETVRQWLHRGGRLWIMLDRTDPALVNELLGDDARHTVIDQIQLNELQLDVGNLGNEDPIAPEKWSSEIPTDFVRVINDGDEVAYRIGNWPAATWRPVGRGEVLFTMLGMPGWISDNEKPTLAISRMSKRIFEPRVSPIDYSDAMQPILENEIGYKIPSRRVAAIILGTNGLIFLVAGIWWARRRTLERMAVLIPVLAFITSGILFWIGNQHTGSVPSTVATAQIAQVVPGTDQLDISSSHAVYSRGDNENGLVSFGRTSAFPLDSLSNQTRRVRWDDTGRSEWQGDVPPPGVVRRYQSSLTKTLERPIRVRGTFDEQGFVASMVGINPEDCSDSLVVAGTGPATSLRVNPSDSKHPLRAGNDDLLPTDQFVSGSLLSEKQRLRQNFLRDVYKRRDQHPFGIGPTALIWTKPFESDLRVRESYESDGVALVSIPIEFDVPASGSLFQIPATFIDLGLAANERGMSTAYNPRTGRWMPEMTNESQADLLFSFPKSLRAMDLKRVNVTIKANAPSRTLSAKCLVEGDPVQAFETFSPTGVVTFSIDRPEMLEQQADGGWWMQIGMSGVNSNDDSSTQEKLSTDNSGESASVTTLAMPKNETSTWTIESVYIDAIGQIDIQPADTPTGQP